MFHPTLVYRIQDWEQHFETRGSRRHQRPLAKISLSTSLEGLVLRRLLSDPQGVAAYGVWILLLQIAAKMPCRGVLADATGAYTPSDLALLTGLPEQQVQAALELLSSPRIGLLELLPLELVLATLADTSLTAHPPFETGNVAAAPATTTAAEIPPSPQPDRDPSTRLPSAVPPMPPPVPSTAAPVRIQPITGQRLPDRLPSETFTVPKFEEFQKLTRESNSPAQHHQPV